MWALKTLLSSTNTELSEHCIVTGMVDSEATLWTVVCFTVECLICGKKLTGEIDR